MRLPVLLAATCVILACREPSPPPATLALVHVAVVDVGNGSVDADQTILVDGARIVSIAPSADQSIPRGTRVVDAEGTWVIPGLWDTHVHAAAGASWHFPLFIAHGVTSVRNMHTTVDTALELVRAVKRRVSEGTLPGPRMIANGPIIDGTPSWPGAVILSDTARAVAVVDSLAEAGADFIKVYDGLSREAYLAITAASARRGISVDGHMPFQVPPDVGASAGQRTVEHLSGMTLGCSSRADSLREEHGRLLAGPTLPGQQAMFAFFALVGAADATRDEALCRSTARSYAEHGVAAVPTLVMGVAGPAGLLDDAERMRGVPEGVASSWRDLASQGFQPIFNDEGLAHAQANVRVLREERVRILAGTDEGNPFLVPGRSLHDELAMLVDSGLSPLEALRAATSGPAETFGMTDSLGAVAEGKLADLVLLRANPLEDIHNTLSIAGVVLAGRYLDRSELDGLLERAEAPGPGGP